MHIYMVVDKDYTKAFAYTYLSDAENKQSEINGVIVEVEGEFEDEMINGIG